MLRNSLFAFFIRVTEEDYCQPHVCSKYRVGNQPSLAWRLEAGANNDSADYAKMKKMCILAHLKMNN